MQDLMREKFILCSLKNIAEHSAVINSDANGTNLVPFMGDGALDFHKHFK